MTCLSSVRRSPTATTTGNGGRQAVAYGRRAQGVTRRGGPAPGHPRPTGWGWLLVIGHVKLSTAVEPLLLRHDVFSHGLPPAGL